MIHAEDRAAIPVKRLLRFVMGLGIAGVIILGALHGLWLLFEANARKGAAVTWTARPVPSGPRLHMAPMNERLDLDRREQQRLSTYGWADRGAGKVHVPIGEAMRAVVQKARKQP